MEGESRCELNKDDANDDENIRGRDSSEPADAIRAARVVPNSSIDILG